MQALGDAGPGRRWLLAVAAPKEIRAVLAGLGVWADEGSVRVRWQARPVNDRFDLVATGVGKANAAAAVARALDPARHAGLINLGVAGALPDSGLSIGDIVDADRCTYADEGIEEPGGFRTIAELGFGPLEGLCGMGSGLEDMSIACTPVLPDDRLALNGLIVRRGPVATVSTCSGTNRLANLVRKRTGAIAEDMESAAVGFTAARIAPGMRFGVIRAVSNTTGDRAMQTWDLDAALDALRRAAACM